MENQTKKRLNEILPNKIYQTGRFFFRLLKKIKNRLNNLRNRVAMQLYKRNLISASRLYEDKYYLKRMEGEHRKRAENFSKAVINILNPESVVDFGCGIGQHLKPFHDNGKKVRGFDIKSICKERNLVPEEKIKIKDLTQEWDIKEEYQLGICLEVLEHIPSEYEHKAVKNISRIVTDTLLVSAAIPGQGGTHHVNERPKDYWEKEFRKEGFLFNEKLTDRIKENLEFDGVRKHNLLVFQRES